MLQRSPTYMVARPSQDQLANKLRRRLPIKLAYWATRWRNVLLGMYFYQMCKRKPDKVKSLLLGGVRQMLGPDYDVDRHFTPRYNPWDQRLCLVPDADFFRAIRRGKVSIVTDHIETFTETGLKLKSGAELAADLIVTATGLVLVPLGKAQAFRRRPRRRSGQDLHLQGHDVLGRAQPRLGVRLHQRLVDAQGRPGLRVCLPADQSHGPRRLSPVHAAQRRSHPGRGAVGEFLLGLYPARAQPTSPSRVPSGRGSSTRTTRSTF